jgi:hypothetical protein
MFGKGSHNFQLLTIVGDAGVAMFPQFFENGLKFYPVHRV